jgi:hypothetical protein
MSKPLVVSLPHRLGKDEAKRRLQAGFGSARTNFAGFFTVQDETWTGDQLNFHLSALGQAAAGTVDVAEDHVKIEVTLPWLLAKFAEKAQSMIQKQGQLMLEKK